MVSIFADPWANTPTIFGTSLPNPLAIAITIAAEACYAGVLIASVVTIVEYEGSKKELDTLSDEYDDMTVSQSELKDGILASTTNYENSVIFYEWASDSLDKMNLNLITQNNDMAKLLQERHLDMETNLNSYLSCSKSMFVVCYVAVYILLLNMVSFGCIASLQ